MINNPGQTMPITFKQTIKKKFILGVVAVIALSALVPTIVAHRFMTGFSELAVTENETRLITQTRNHLSRLSLGRSSRYSEIFTKAASLTREIADRAEHILNNQERYAQINFNKTEQLRYRPANEVWANEAGDRVSVSVGGLRHVPANILAEITALSHLDNSLALAQKAGPAYIAAYIQRVGDLPDGYFAYARYYPNVDFIDSLPPVRTFDLRQEAYIRLASPQANPNRLTIWTPIAPDFAGQGLITTVSAPIYTSQGFFGTASMDISMSGIMDEIQGVSSTDNPQKAPVPSMNERFLLLDATGQCLALPSDLVKAFGLPTPSNDTPLAYASPDFNLLKSADPDVREIARQIIGEGEGPDRVMLRGEPWHLASRELTPTGWRLGTMIRESEVLASIHKTRASFDVITTAMTVSYSISVGLIAILAVCAFYLFFQLYLSRPLKLLTGDIERFSQGDLDHRASPVRDDEIGDLAQAFNQMAERIQKSQAEIRKAEENYRSIFENAAEGLFRGIRRTRLTSVNPAMTRIMGYDSAEELLANVQNTSRPFFVTPDDYDRLNDLLDKHDSVPEFVTCLRRKDGSVFHAAISLRAIRSSANELSHYEGSVVDITDRVAREAAELERGKALAATQAKNEFLANMSHEIRTPLSGILGLTEMLSNDTATAESRQHYLGLIKDASHSLLSIVNDAMDLTRIESREFSLELADFDLPGLLARVASNYHLLAEAKGLELNLRLGDNLPETVNGDGDRLEQILGNLLSNALKYTDEGVITLSAECQEHYDTHHVVSFAVADTGLGIPPQDTEKLFQSFVQLDSSFSKKHGGAGLGLAITRQLVRLMGGEITVESEPGQGSIFSLEIRLGLVGSTTATASPSDQPSVASGPPQDAEEPPFPKILQGRRILAVDDNPANQAFMEHFLTQAGCLPVTASNGREALELFAKNSFDAVLMDIKMPVMDGIAATRAIRDLEKQLDSPGTPVIGMSAFDANSDLTRPKNGEFDAYLTKPVSSGALLRLLASMLNARAVVTDIPRNPEQ